MLAFHILSLFLKDSKLTQKPKDKLDIISLLSLILLSLLAFLILSNNLSFLLLFPVNISFLLIQSLPYLLDK